MAHEEKYKTELPHNVIMEGREKLSVSGVEDVESFDEETIVLHTTKGLLVVRGKELHIEKLSLDGGDLSVEGRIESLKYEEDKQAKGGLMARLFQ